MITLLPSYLGINIIFANASTMDSMKMCVPTYCTSEEAILSEVYTALNAILKLIKMNSFCFK